MDAGVPECNHFHLEASGCLVVDRGLGFAGADKLTVLIF